MSIRSEWINRLRHLARGSRFESDLEDEIRFHIETRAAELEQSGISGPDALAQARREFGSIALAQEDSRAPGNFAGFRILPSIFAMPSTLSAAARRSRSPP